MDKTSEKYVATLLPSVQPYARAFWEEANKACPPGFSVRIISGNRTYAEQNALYAQGRSKPGSIVTNARGGQSNHNFRIAFDIGVFQGEKYLGSHDLYNQLGAIGERVGLEWGGRWERFRDTPHYQAATGLSLRQLRALVGNGQTIPVPPFGVHPVPQGNVPVILKESDTGVISARTLPIPAFLIGGRTFVALRPFIGHFGGEVAAVDRDQALIVLNGEQIEVPLKNIDGKGFAPFSAVNELLDLDFSYKAGTLTVDVTEVP